MPERPTPSSSLSERARQLLADVRSLSTMTFPANDAPARSLQGKRYEVLTLAPWACAVPCRVAIPSRASILRSAF